MSEEQTKNNSDLIAEKIAVFDLDGTITYKDTYVDFLLYCLRKRPSRILRGGALVVYLLMYKSGIRSNHWLKARYLGTVAGGLHRAELDSLAESFSQQSFEKNIKPEALQELSELKARGYTLVLATASFEFYVSKLFVLLKMDYLLCSSAVFDSRDCLVGKLAGKNCLGAEKARRVRELCAEQQWSGVELAYSDDMVDEPLFELADTALVVDPKPMNESKARSMGYRVLNWR